MRGRIVVVVLALGLVSVLGAACDDEPAPPAFPSSAFPSQTPVTIGPTGTSTGPTTGATGTSTGSTGPTTGATGSTGGGGTGDLTEGHLDLRVTGDVQAQKTLTNLISGAVSPPPGGFAVVWTAGGLDATTVGLGGGTTIGTQPTSATLVVSLAAQTKDGLHSWTSTEGECAVRITTATTTRFAGSFACRDLASTDGAVVDVSATFEATG